VRVILNVLKSYRRNELNIVSHKLSKTYRGPRAPLSVDDLTVRNAVRTFAVFCIKLKLFECLLVVLRNSFKTRYYYCMNTKPLTPVLLLCFLFLFGSSSVLFADDFKDALDAFDREDYETLYKLTVPLAEKGNAKAQYILGGMYSEGLGGVQDYREAVKWYRLAAEQGDAKAQYHLGVVYHFGRGVPQDHKEAVKWSKIAAEQGLAEAQYNLGLMYYHGEGIPQDYVLAYMWWNLSGSQGQKSARKNRDILEEEMTQQQVEKAQEMARSWKPKK